MPLRQYSAAELLITERQRLERPLLILIFMSICTFGFAQGQMIFILGATLAVGINFMAAWRKHEVYLARAWVNLGVLMSTILLVADLFVLRMDQTVALGDYLMLILLCKLFEKKGNRDYVQMLGLSLLLMIASSLLAVDIWLAAMTLAYLVLGCYTAMVFTLKRGLDAVAGQQLKGESDPQAPQRVAWNVARDWPASDLRRKLAMLLVTILAMAAGAFLFLPRMPAVPLPALAITPPSDSPNFASDLALGQTDEVYLSKRMLGRLKLEGRRPLSDGVYIRARTFSRYEKSRWPVPRYHERAAFLPRLSQGPPTEPAIVQELWFDPGVLPDLPTVAPAVYVESEESATALRCDGHFNWSLSGRSVTPRWLHYKAWTLTRPLADGDRERLLQSPRQAGPIDPELRDIEEARSEISPRVADLAQTWCADLLAQRRAGQEDRELDLQIARRIAQRLQANYPYSLDLRGANRDRDAVEDFLFHLKRGHCEYFASAMTVMCQSLRVPARLATGFRVDETSRRDDEYIIRGRDAHAWTEVYGPDGWTIVDATGFADEREGANGWWQRLQDYWAQLKTGWYDNVVTYDEGSHAAVTQKVAGWFSGIWSAIKGWGSSIADGFVNLLERGEVDRAILTLSILLGVLAIVLEAILVLRHIRHRRRRREDLAQRPEFFQRLQAILAGRGLQREPTQSYREQAVAAAGALSVPEADLLYLVEAYYRARWGAEALDSSQLALCSQKVESLQQLLRKRR